MAAGQQSEQIWVTNDMKDSAKTRALIILSCAAMTVAARAADVVPMTFINGLPFVEVAVGATSSSLMIDSGGSLGISIPEMTVEKSGRSRYSIRQRSFVT